ncbi:tripartite tricarboxylate transporter substrate-binding protein [Vibrio diazotrophicus]|uniref:Tripartite tricarboxylate transporter substrate-binding protein n=1 Tax=Vibrio diazotrophicus TaxID=685 RepID=A0A2J8HWE4_VIBDI|nr:MULTISPECIES: tripartite tricarboxylate transporter substrate binding protein [Vibrio]MCF7363770.1 tripartite tricarboxylate transporter substrate binding protein [Vibrio sp. A1-b2]PNI02596.1 tripartite tricarboxylate transporter substrate-binding protein [Vibrio diazotrophicus]
MKRVLQLSLITAAMVASSSAMAAWPEKPIQIIVPWGAGGNTDTVARLVAEGLQEQLGVNVNVINRTGGAGVVGHDAMAKAKPDGYTLGVATVEIAMMRHQGMTDLNYENYTPVTRLAVNLGGIQVASNSQFSTISELTDYIKSHPGELKASGSGLNSGWHLNLVGMLDAMGVASNAVTYVPSEGSSSALMELVSGGIDFTTSSPGEAKSMVDAGMVKNLATMAETNTGLYKDIPVFQQATDYSYSFSTWNTLVAPAGISKEIQDKLIATMKTVFAEGKLQQFATKQGFEVYPLYGDELAKFMKSEDDKYGKLIGKLSK